MNVRVCSAFDKCDDYIDHSFMFSASCFDGLVLILYLTCVSQVPVEGERERELLIKNLNRLPVHDVSLAR